MKKMAAQIENTNTEISDEEKAEYLFNRTWNTLLQKIVSGEIDAREVAWSELRSRGLDQNGAWVGFGKDKIARPF